MNTVRIGEDLRATIIPTGELSDFRSSRLYPDGVKRAGERKKLQLCPENQDFLEGVLHGIKGTVSELRRPVHLLTEGPTGTFRLKKLLGG